MSQNITIMGSSYSDVPAVTLPKTGGGTAYFTDVTDTTAAAADVASGKYFYTASGVRTQGTNSGGGGDNSFIVFLSWDDVDELWAPDKTIEEIQNAYTSGKEIAFVCQETFNPTYWFYDDDYVFIYGVYVASGIPNQFLQKEYLYNTDGVTSLGDTVLLYPRFEYPTRTYTPTEVQQVDTITYNSSDYNGIEEVSVTVNAIPSNYVGSGITRRSSSDLTASGATVSVPSGYYQSNSSKAVASGTAGTPTATKGSVSNHSISVTPSVTNTTGYITGSTINGTAVTVTASELASGNKEITSNGTNIDVVGYSTVSVNVAGSSGMQVATATAAPNSAAASISFTNLQGEPTSFYIMSAADLATGVSPYKTAAVVFDGTNIFGSTITNTSNAQVSYDSTHFSKTYSNGTLTVTGSTYWQANQYKLVYTYGGNSANIGTADVQVGSGATSITFTGLTDEPTCFSCLFKSDFSTSSGYQRVIGVVFDGTTTYGLAMDSGAKAATSWTYSYSNGSLTITSSGTNAGGYFHQPGYYQLTYGIGGEVELTVEPLSVTENGVYSESGKAYSPVTVNVSGGGGANIATETMTNSSNQNTSISFTLPSGRTPKAFFARLTSQIARSSNSRYYYVFDMRWDGSSTGGVAGNTFYMSSGTLTNVTSGYSYSQSGTAFTLSSTGSRSASPGSFYNGTYELMYAY